MFDCQNAAVAVVDQRPDSNSWFLVAESEGYELWSQRGNFEKQSRIMTVPLGKVNAPRPKAGATCCVYHPSAKCLNLRCITVGFSQQMSALVLPEDIAAKIVLNPSGRGSSSSYFRYLANRAQDANRNFICHHIVFCNPEEGTKETRFEFLLHSSVAKARSNNSRQPSEVVSNSAASFQWEPSLPLGSTSAPARTGPSNLRMQTLPSASPPSPYAQRQRIREKLQLCQPPNQPWCSFKDPIELKLRYLSSYSDFDTIASAIRKSERTVIFDIYGRDGDYSKVTDYVPSCIEIVDSSIILTLRPTVLQAIEDVVNPTEIEIYFEVLVSPELKHVVEGRISFSMAAEAESDDSETEDYSDTENDGCFVTELSELESADLGHSPGEEASPAMKSATSSDDPIGVVTHGLNLIPTTFNIGDPKDFVLLDCIGSQEPQPVQTLESEHHRPYGLAQQECFNPTIRAIIIDWMIEVQEGLKLAPDVLSVAVDIVDRLLVRISVTHSQLLLLGTAAIYRAHLFASSHSRDDVDDYMASLWKNPSAPETAQLCETAANWLLLLDPQLGKKLSIVGEIPDMPQVDRDRDPTVLQHRETQMDIVLVLDQSGSVGCGWRATVEFANKIVESPRSNRAV
jgi:hypothetical protein